MITEESIKRCIAALDAVKVPQTGRIAWVEGIGFIGGDKVSTGIKARKGQTLEPGSTPGTSTSTQ